MARKELPSDTWDEIGRRWRMGASESQLSAEFEVSRKAIYNKRTAEGWVRDLKTQLNQAVTAKVARQVASEVAGGATFGGITAIPADPSTMSSEEDAQAVEVLSDVASRIVGEHRGAARRGRQIAARFFDELEFALANRAAIEDAVVAETAEADGDGPAAAAARVKRSQMLRAVSLPVQVAVLRDLSTVLKNLVPIERQALGLDDDKAAPPANVTFNLDMRGRGREPRTIDG